MRDRLLQCPSPYLEPRHTSADVPSGLGMIFKSELWYRNVDDVLIRCKQQFLQHTGLWGAILYKIHRLNAAVL